MCVCVCFVAFFSTSVSLSQKCTYAFIASHSRSVNKALFAHLFALTYSTSFVCLKADTSIWLEFGSRAQTNICEFECHTHSSAREHTHTKSERYILCEANKRFCTPKNFTAAYQDYVLLTQFCVLLHPLLLVEMLFLLFATFLLCVLSLYTCCICASIPI